jgi:dipeptidyl-peptidase-3
MNCIFSFSFFFCFLTRFSRLLSAWPASPVLQLSMARAGVLGLEFWSPDTGAWRQAHMQARFAILRTMLDASAAAVASSSTDGEFLRIEFNEARTDATIHLNRALIRSVGVPAVAALLQRIQVYRSTADVAAATAMYIGDRTRVDGVFVELRRLVMDKKKPRSVFVQANTTLGADGRTVTLKQYAPTPEGMIASFVDRFAPSAGAAPLPAPLYAL